jgi:hypothetical protein
VADAAALDAAAVEAAGAQNKQTTTVDV